MACADMTCMYASQSFRSLKRKNNNELHSNLLLNELYNFGDRLFTTWLKPYISTLTTFKYTRYNHQTNILTFLKTTRYLERISKNIPRVWPNYTFHPVYLESARIIPVRNF